MGRQPEGWVYDSTGILVHSRELGQGANTAGGGVAYDDDGGPSNERWRLLEGGRRGNEVLMIGRGQAGARACLQNGGSS